MIIYKEKEKKTTKNMNTKCKFLVSNDTYKDNMNEKKKQKE